MNFFESAQFIERVKVTPHRHIRNAKKLRQFTYSDRPSRANLGDDYFMAPRRKRSGISKLISGTDGCDFFGLPVHFHTLPEIRLKVNTIAQFYCSISSSWLFRDVCKHNILLYSPQTHEKS